MASKKQTNKFDIKTAGLMLYLSVAVMMVALTLFLAFSDQGIEASNSQVTPMQTPTILPSVLTLQAEDYETIDQQLTREASTPSATSNP